MIDVERRLRDFCDGMDAAQGEVGLDDVFTERLVVPPVPGHRPARSGRMWPAWATAVAAFAAVLVVGAVVWLLGVRGGPAPVGDDGPVTTAVPLGSFPDGALLDGTWSLEASYEGWLMDPIPFGDGYAAIRKLEPGREFFVETEGENRAAEILAGGEVSVGDVWVSSDGIEWAPAGSQPPERPWMLTGDGETLFAETGNLFSGGGTIWVSDDGVEWRPVLVPGEYQRLVPMRPGGGSLGHRWDHIDGTVTAGPPGAVVFGVDGSGDFAGWHYDGERFAPSDVQGISALGPLAVWGDPRDFQVAVLSDRFLLATLDSTTYESATTMKVSSSTDGAVWGPLEPKPDPLARPDAEIDSVGGRDGLDLAGLSRGYGLWATRDGSAWDEVVLRPSGNGWVPTVAAGEFGWVVSSPSRRMSPWVATEEPANRGLWYSPDGAVWGEIDEVGPADEFWLPSIAVRSDDVLVFVPRNGGAWGVPDRPVTEVWRLVLTPVDAATVTVSFRSVGGLDGLYLAARVFAADAGSQVLGTTHVFGRYFGTSLSAVGDPYTSGIRPIGPFPLSGSDVVRTTSTVVGSQVGDGVAGFAPGRYRLVIEAALVPEPVDVARYGCEIPIEVEAGEPLEVTITDLPDFAGGGDRWTPGPDGRYPACPGG